MAVTIVGTLEMIYTDTLTSQVVSEGLDIDMPSPTAVPLNLASGLVFLDPAIDVRDTLEPYLATEHELTSIARVGSPRAGALAEWTAINSTGNASAVVLWNTTPLEQVGIEWAQYGTGDTTWGGDAFEAISIGAGSKASGERAIAVGSAASATRKESIGIGYDSDADGLRSLAFGSQAKTEGSASNAFGFYATTASGDTYTTEIAANILRVLRRLPDRTASASASVLELSTSTGSLQSIGVTASSITLNGVPISTGAASWGMITGTITSQTDLISLLAGYSPASHTHTWASITGKPTTFAPSAHTHAYDDLTGKPTIPTTLAALDTTVTGAQLNALKTKVDGVATGATANATDAALRARSSHTGAQAISTVTGLQTALDGKATTAQGTKADTAVQPAGIANFETTTQLNSRDTANRSRANHTGNQAISTVTNLQEILDGKPIVVNPGNRSTAIGVDAQASSVSSFAAGDTATAGGFQSVAVGVDTQATGDYSTALGTGASAVVQSSTALGTHAAASGVFASAFGPDSIASGGQSTAIGASTQALGASSTAIGSSAVASSFGAVAFGYDAQALGASSTAIGANTLVPATSPRSQALGSLASVPDTTPDTTVIMAKSLWVTPVGAAGTLASTLTLRDTSGNPHVIPAWVGQTHSFSANASPGGESLTGVGTYTTGGVLRTGTLTSLIPAITTGLWDLDIEATALVYRSVTTGGVYLFVGNGTAAVSQALGRLSPQTHAYTLTMFTSPNTGFAAVGPSQVIDLRYTGFSTAGTTNVVSHGWKITARRVG